MYGPIQPIRMTIARHIGFLIHIITILLHMVVVLVVMVRHCCGCGGIIIWFGLRVLLLLLGLGVACRSHFCSIRCFGGIGSSIFRVVDTRCGYGYGFGGGTIRFGHDCHWINIIGDGGMYAICGRRRRHGTRP